MPTVLQPGGVSKSGRRGVGTEFMELREYRPGDDIRSVDWKASSRLNRLVVKVFEQESFLNVAIVLDASPSMYRGVVGHTRIEYAARLAVSLAEYLARRGDRYRLYLFPPAEEGFIPRPRVSPWLRGRWSGSYARRWLAERLTWPREPGGVDVAARSRVLGRVLASSLPRGRTLVFYIGDPGGTRGAGLYAQALVKLVRQRNRVYAVIPVTVSFEAAALEGRLEAALYRLLSLEAIEAEARKLHILRRAGVRAYAASPGDLLSIILSRIEAERGAAL